MSRAISSIHRHPKLGVRVLHNRKMAVHGKAWNVGNIFNKINNRRI